MNPSEIDALMNAVLDGEATPDESRQLERALAADPSAKGPFQRAPASL
jgi:anti-sigma factor RsiW